MMDFKSLKTLVGLTLEELIQKLDEQLPKDAYKAVPGGANLTDIDPNWMRKTLNQQFGLCGVGWGYTYASDDITFNVEDRQTNNGGTRVVYVATLKRLRFWYKLVDGSNVEYRQEIDASGGSENSNASFAMKGAITNALGNAVSNIGFQESVYLGLRDHRTVRQSAAAQKAVSKKAAVPAKPATAPASKPAPAVPEAIQPALAPKPSLARGDDDTADFVIPVGTRAGQTLSQVWKDDPKGPDAIAFYAGMTTGGNKQKELLKQMATTFLSKVKANGHEPIAA